MEYQLSNHPDSGKGFEGGGEGKITTEKHNIAVFNYPWSKCIITFRFVVEEFENHIEIELKNYDAEEFIDDWNNEIRYFLKEKYAKKVEYQDY